MFVGFVRFVVSLPTFLGYSRSRDSIAEAETRFLFSRRRGFAPWRLSPCRSRRRSPRGPGADFEIEPLTLTAPRDDEVLVRIKAVGLCHTDIGVRDASVLPFPRRARTRGRRHRRGGRRAVDKVAPGDRVLITFRSCGVCARCRSGEPTYCDRFLPMNFGGARLDGSSSFEGGGVASNFFGQSSFATHALTYERNLVKLPPDVPFAVAAPPGLRRPDRRGRDPARARLPTGIVRRGHRRRDGGAERGYGGQGAGLRPRHPDRAGGSPPDPGPGARRHPRDRSLRRRDRPGGSRHRPGRGGFRAGGRRDPGRRPGRVRLYGDARRPGSRGRAPGAGRNSSCRWISPSSSASACAA